MPLISEFALPHSAAALSPAEDIFFVIFTTSNDPATGQSWCPDVRAALPRLQAAFATPNTPEAAVVQVGQRPGWRVPTNVFRTTWNVHNVPTIVRFERIDGSVKETGRLVEDEILDQRRLAALVDGTT